MDDSFLFRTEAIWIALALAVLMIAAALGGAAAARRTRRRAVDRSALASIETGLLGLLGLLLAFTFAAAAARFDGRGVLMTDAANAIRIAILDADLYDATERSAFRADLSAYVESRIALYAAGYDEREVRSAQTESDALQARLWQRAVRLSRDPQTAFASAQMLPALGRIATLASARSVAMRLHVADIVIVVLFVTAVTTTFASGYAAGLGGGFSLVGYAGFAFLTALVVYVTLDFDRAGRGFIRSDVQAEGFVELRGLLQRSQAPP